MRVKTTSMHPVSPAALVCLALLAACLPGCGFNDVTARLQDWDFTVRATPEGPGRASVLVYGPGFLGADSVQQVVFQDRDMREGVALATMQSTRASLEVRLPRDQHSLTCFVEIKPGHVVALQLEFLGTDRGLSAVRPRKLAENVSPAAREALRPLLREIPDLTAWLDGALLDPPRLPSPPSNAPPSLLPVMRDGSLAAEVLRHLPQETRPAANRPPTLLALGRRDVVKLGFYTPPGPDPTESFPSEQMVDNWDLFDLRVDPPVRLPAVESPGLYQPPMWSPTGYHGPPPDEPSARELASAAQRLAPFAPKDASLALSNDGIVDRLKNAVGKAVKLQTTLGDVSGQLLSVDSQGATVRVFKTNATQDLAFPLASVKGVQTR